MIRISLSAEENAELNRLRLTKKSNIGERAHYVLLSDEGKSVKEIAAHLSRNEHTVRLWLNRYLMDGITGLSSRNNPGRPAKKAPVIESQLQELLNKSPQEYGYQEACIIHSISITDSTRCRSRIPFDPDQRFQLMPIKTG